MALTQKLSTEAVNAEVAALGALLDGGFLDIYSGSQPANANAAVGAAVLLASLQFGSPAFGSPTDGAALANAIANEDDAPATGTATWYRCYKADHTSPIQDGSVGEADSNLILNDVDIVQHAVVSVNSFLLTASKQ